MVQIDIIFAQNEDGAILGWGKNSHGQLGIGNTIDQAVPVEVEFPETISSRLKKIVTGDEHSLFLFEHGSLYACGNNKHGELGAVWPFKDGPLLKPRPVLRDKDIKDIWAATDISMVLIKGKDGVDELYVCGNNRKGRLGLAKAKTKEKSGILCIKKPEEESEESEDHIFVFHLVPFFTGKKIKDIYLSVHYSFVLLEDNSLYGFGENFKGVLDSSTPLTDHGLGWDYREYAPIYEPILIPHFKGKSPIKDICPGAAHVLVLLSNGSLYSWGSNSLGELGLSLPIVDGIDTPKRISFFQEKEN